MRKHQWKDLPRDSPWSERVCTVCGLEDRKDSKGPWLITTPCIEPVPERVSFEALVAELRAHPVEIEISYGIRRTQTMDEKIRCEGVPGKWFIGLTGGKYLFRFRSPLDGSGLMMDLHHPELELGFARLLRDLRAREYDPFKYSDYRRAVEDARRSDSECCFDD